MKKILLILLFFFPASNINAQQYIPFPTSNATWRENGTNVSGLTAHQFCFYEISITNDTVVNAFTYHEIQETGWSYEMLYHNGGWHGPYYGTGCSFNWPGALREDNQKKIYYYSYNDGTEYLLYDFNLSLGDTLPPTYINWANTNFVTAVDSINIHGQYHKQFHIAEISDPNSTYAAYIEGVGSTMEIISKEQLNLLPT